MKPVRMTIQYLRNLRYPQRWRARSEGKIEMRSERTDPSLTAAQPVRVFA
jgi:hypothetical protein